MLSAGTTASVGINTDVLIIDFYIQTYLVENKEMQEGEVFYI